MFYKFRKNVAKMFYDSMTVGIRKKAKVSVDSSSGFVLLTQLCSSDVNMYLVAVTSFCKYLVPKRIVVVSDRLSAEEVSLLKSCIEDLQVIPIETARIDSLPHGGCWERLLSILGLLEDEQYVVQLDADTITMGYPVEVDDAIKCKRSFTLATRMGKNKITLSEISDSVKDIESDHIQILLEKSFSQMKDSDQRYYVRGCAGFAGFAKGASTVKSLVEFGKEAEALVGKENWSRWGSEQVASNYVVANAENSMTLPFSRYPYFDPKSDMSGAVFLHFLGGKRFKNNKYVKLSRKHINEL